MKHIKAYYKYILSFRKKDWEFKDYPLETWENTNAEQNEIKFVAKFTNWSLFVAHGESKKIAIENLKNQFRDFKANNVEIPRPGKNVPIQFAATTEIEKYESIAVDFFDRIIGIEYYNCFISDYSCLDEFDIDVEEAIRKIKTYYNIEPHKDLVFVDIFRQIEEASA
jgi:hypothetical protein